MTVRNVIRNESRSHLGVIMPAASIESARIIRAHNALLTALMSCFRPRWRYRPSVSSSFIPAVGLLIWKFDDNQG